MTVSNWQKSMSETPEIVYLIDDDAGIRAALKGLLESRGKTVIAFESGQHYLQHARTDTVACLLLDLELPGISGLDLQRQLSAEADPPIVFLSGRGDSPSHEGRGRGIPD